MKTGRLLRLASLLDSYQDIEGGIKFDLGCWGGVRTKRTGLFRREVTCHTTACAVGLACLSGEFTDDGLSWELCKKDLLPVYMGAREYPAVQLFFGINDRDAHHLFGWEEYDGAILGKRAAAAVAARIRKFVGVDETPLTKHHDTVKMITSAALVGAGISDD